MPFVESLKPAFLVSVVLLVVSLALHIAGMATPHWGEVDTIYFGIWQLCQQYVTCISITGAFLNSSIRTCQAFSVLAILLTTAALVMCVVHVNKEEATQTGRRLYLMIASIFTSLACICIIICLAVWRSADFARGSILGYSFFLSLAGAVFLFLSLAFGQFYARQLVRRSYQVMP